MSGILSKALVKEVGSVKVRGKMTQLWGCFIIFYWYFSDNYHLKVWVKKYLRKNDTFSQKGWMKSEKDIYNITDYFCFK